MKSYRADLQEFYHSKEWSRCRNSYMSYCGGLCERCKAQGYIVPAKIVHHKIYLDQTTVKDPSIALNFDNLEAVCMECHNKEHFHKERSLRWKMIDGELVILGE